MKRHEVPGQLPLWEPPAPPAPTTRRSTRRHRYEAGARPATRPHGYYLTRGTRTINLTGDYL